MIENLKENHCMPHPVPKKPKNMTRIVALNPNGAHPKEIGGMFDRVLEDEADTNMCSEVCVDNMKTKTIETTHKMAKKHFKNTGCRMNIAGSKTPAACDCKPGEAMMVTTGTAAGRTQSRTCDPMGRWMDKKMVEKMEELHMSSEHLKQQMCQSQPQQNDGMQLACNRWQR